MASGRPDYTSQSLIKGSDAGTHRTVAVDPAGNLLTLIKGQFGGVPVTIAVDAAGNILGVLQGEYAGTLKTLAVDDKGRMLAVLTDPEDVFGNPHYMGAAELAARLGSCAVLDRRGQVLFQDPGGTNLSQYIVSGVGVASTAVECATGGQISQLCYKLVAGPADGNSESLVKRVPRVEGNKTGFEVTIAVDANLGELLFGLSVNDGAITKQGIIKYSRVLDKLYYYTAGPLYTEFAALALLGDETYPHVFKLVIDESAGKYVRLRIDTTIYDLSAYDLYTANVIQSTSIASIIEVVAHTGGTITNYIGLQIITVGED